MDFSFTEGQLAIAGLAKKIYTERATHAAIKATEATPDRVDPRLWADLANTGLLGTSIGEAYGGSGHGLLEVMSLLESTGAAVAPVPVWETLLLGALPIERYGSEAQRATWLPKVVAGEAVLTAALSTPGSFDPRATRVEAERAGDAYHLRGIVTCVPAAHVASRIVVPARVGAQTALFLLDPAAAGVRRERQVTTHHHIEEQLTFEGAVAELLPGSLTDPNPIDGLVDRATVGLVGMQLGVARRALEMTAQYTATRHQFERPIATFQAVSQRAADAYIDVESIELVTWAAAWRLAEGLDAAEAVAVAKMTAAESGYRVVAAAQHLHGGMGFDLDYPLYRHYLWSKHIELSLGGLGFHTTRLGDLLATR